MVFHPQPDYGAEFGHAVATDGQRLVVGAHRDGSTDLGSAHVFLRDSGMQPPWSIEQSLYTPDPEEEFAYFGASVAVEGNRIVVGADFIDCDKPQLGRLYTFGLDGGSWTWIQRMQDKNAKFATFFGVGLDVENGWVLAGGWWSPDAYLFQMRDLMLDATPEVAADGDTLSFHAGIGQVKGPVALVLTALDGVPQSQTIASGSFSAPDGMFGFSTTVPPGLSGVEVQLQAFGTSQFGQLTDSNPVTVHFE